jgi:hypothetical protein
MVIILGYLIGGLFVTLLRCFLKAIALWMIVIGVFFGSIFKVDVAALNKDFNAIMNFKIWV